MGQTMSRGACSPSRGRWKSLTGFSLMAAALVLSLPGVRVARSDDTPAPAHRPVAASCSERPAAAPGVSFWSIRRAAAAAAVQQKSPDTCSETAPSTSPGPDMLNARGYNYGTPSPPVPAILGN